MLIKIPDERATQLKALADREAITVTDLLGRFINREIKVGRLPDETPGFRFKPIGRKVQIEIDGIKAPAIPHEDARSLADQLERIAIKGGAFLDADAPGSFQVGRVGNGVYLQFVSNGAKARRVLAPSVTLDVARQLRRAAKAANPPLTL